MKRAVCLVASFLILTACGDIPVSQQTTTTTQPKNAAGGPGEAVTTPSRTGLSDDGEERVSSTLSSTSAATSPVTSPHVVCESFSGWTYLAEECRP